MTNPNSGQNDYAHQYFANKKFTSSYYEEYCYRQQQLEDNNDEKRTMHQGPFVIPEISDHTIHELIDRIVPVITLDNNKIYHVSFFSDIYYARNTSYIFDCKPLKEAKYLKELTRIKTLHTYGHYCLFKPTIAEVLAQIPKSNYHIAAFEVIGPQDANDLNKEKKALDAGYHVATTILYKLGM